MKLLTVLLAAFAAPVLADGLPPLPPQPALQAPARIDPGEFARNQMRHFDSNTDGRVDWNEFSAKLKANFREVSRGKDSITEKDFRDFFEKVSRGQ